MRTDVCSNKRLEILMCLGLAFSRLKMPKTCVVTVGGAAGASAKTAEDTRLILSASSWASVWTHSEASSVQPWKKLASAGCGFEVD